jgi:hypothetical protein
VGLTSFPSIFLQKPPEKRFPAFTCHKFLEAASNMNSGAIKSILIAKVRIFVNFTWPGGDDK